MTQLATAALGFVAALAWNDAVKGLINRFIHEGDGLASKIYYAVIVTAIAVGVTYYLGKETQEQSEKEIKK